MNISEVSIWTIKAHVWSTVMIGNKISPFFGWWMLRPMLLKAPVQAVSSAYPRLGAIRLNFLVRNNHYLYCKCSNRTVDNQMQCSKIGREMMKF